MNRLTTTFTLLTFLLLRSLESGAATNAGRLFDKPSINTGPLFADTVVAKGKGVEVKQSQVDEMYLAFKGQRAAMGQEVPDNARSRVEADILDKLIAMQLFVARATNQDKAKAKEIAESFLADQRKQAPSDDSYRRQLLAMGMTPEQFASQIGEQAIIKAVIDRELKTTKSVTDAEAMRFYAENPSLFQEPELVRATHIFISTRDKIAGKALTPELKLEKKQLAARALARVKAGEDFAKVRNNLSEDPASKSRGGEYTFARAKDDPRRAMAPEFEAAAFSMGPNQVSDIVETSYGYHIIKVFEKIPPKKVAYSQVETRIKESLLRDAVDKDLPAYILKLRKEAGVQVLLAGGNK